MPAARTARCASIVLESCGSSEGLSMPINIVPRAASIAIVAAAIVTTAAFQLAWGKRSYVRSSSRGGALSSDRAIMSGVTTVPHPRTSISRAAPI